MVDIGCIFNQSSLGVCQDYISLSVASQARIARSYQWQHYQSQNIPFKISIRFILPRFIFKTYLSFDLFSQNVPDPTECRHHIKFGDDVSMSLCLQCSRKPIAINPRDINYRGTLATSFICFQFFSLRSRSYDRRCRINFIESESPFC